MVIPERRPYQGGGQIYFCVLITRKGNATRVEPLRIEICTVAIALVRFRWCWSAVVFVHW